MLGWCGSLDGSFLSLPHFSVTHAAEIWTKSDVNWTSAFLKDWENNLRWKRLAYTAHGWQRSTLWPPSFFTSPRQTTKQTAKESQVEYPPVHWHGYGNPWLFPVREWSTFTGIFIYLSIAMLNCWVPINYILIWIIIPQNNASSTCVCVIKDLHFDGFRPPN